MKKFWCYPTKKFKSDDDVESYIQSVTLTVMARLGIAGYKVFIFMPGDESWHDAEDRNAGLTVRVDHPYKKINLSVQVDTLKKARREPITSGFFGNLVHGIVHEMVHVILWDLVVIARARCITMRELDDMEEKTTDHFANILNALLRQDI